jgi:ATP-dependent helicase/nuclease subunit B
MTVSATPFGAPYLEILAETLLQRHGATPHSLAEVVVFLPTRRAVKTLEDLLFAKQEQNGATAILLPHITSITELSPSLPYPLPPTPPTASPLQRQLTLAKQLISAQYSLPQALGIAETLLPILDEFHAADKTAAALELLDTGSFSAHWAKTTELLTTALNIDKNSPVSLAKQALRALCTYWEKHPTEKPVYAAGILNISPYILEFLESVHRLPQGNVVLPNVDLQRANPQETTLPLWHPQQKIAKTLEYLGVEHENLELLTQKAKIAPLSQQNIARLLMLPANALKQWHTADSGAIEQGLKSLNLLDCSTTEEEALCIALKMREGLIAPKQRVALVTADKNLAERVTQHLLRWNIVPNNSSGTPLKSTPPAIFLQLLLDATQPILQPIALLSLLKHPLTRQNFEPQMIRRYARAFECLVLRAPRRGNTLATYTAALAKALEKKHSSSILRQYGITAEEITGWFENFLEICAPLQHSFATLHDALQQLLAVAAALSTDSDGICQLWQKEAGVALAEAVATILPETHVSYRPQELPFLLSHLLKTGVVAADYGFHPRCNIWGVLEAQGQTADVVIIGGLQQDILPHRPEANPFLNRAMREQVGLPLPELEISQEAHTFCSLLMANEVLLTYSHRKNGSPALPSPWIEKLYALATLHKSEHSLTKQHPLKIWSQQLDKPASYIPLAEPRPCPPQTARPRTYSASAVSLLQKNPYAFYARYVLRLMPLEALDSTPDARDQGTILHRIFETFTRMHPETLPENTQHALQTLAEQIFRDAFDMPEAILFWEQRFRAIAQWFTTKETVHRADWKPLYVEHKGQIRLGQFALAATADRIDTHRFGNVLQCIDYKTGMPPSMKDILNGQEVQLLIQALIAQRGGFGHASPSRIGAASYWGLLGKNKMAGKIVTLEEQLETLLPIADAYFLKLFQAFDNDTQPYLVKPLPWKKAYSDYAHLERQQEWA